MDSQTINDELVEALSSLLNDVTTSGKTKTLYETKFAVMGKIIEKHVCSFPTLINFFRRSLQEAMIRRLTVTDSDKVVLQKTEDYFASLKFITILCYR